MAIYDLLPSFHQVEPNNLKGLLPGFVISQIEVKEGCTLIKEVNDKKYFENGHLVRLTSDGIDQWADGSDMLLVYSDPLPTITREARHYATDLANECVRCVILQPGDEWMTDIDYESDEKYSALWTEINKHVIKVDGSTKLGNASWFKVNTLADGTKGYHYIFLGNSKVTA